MLGDLKLSKLEDKIVVIYGATASGKSEFAFNLACQLSKEIKRQSHIINADSMQVYYELPIITAQPSKEQMAREQHKLYGFISCFPEKIEINRRNQLFENELLFENAKDSSYQGYTDKFSVGQWVNLVQKEIDSCIQNNIMPLVVGGTGMYISALYNGLAIIPSIDPEVVERLYNLLDHGLNIEDLYNMLQEYDAITAAKIKPRDTQRVIRAIAVYQQTGKPLSYWHSNQQLSLYPQSKFYKIFINQDRTKLYKRINSRFNFMLQNGVIDEVSNVIETGLPDVKAIGIQEIASYLEGNIDYNTMVENSTRLTRNYAKRQLTWFRNKFVPDLIIE